MKLKLLNEVIKVAANEAIKKRFLKEQTIGLTPEEESKMLQFVQDKLKYYHSIQGKNIDAKNFIKDIGLLVDAYKQKKRTSPPLARKYLEMAVDLVS